MAITSLTFFKPVGIFKSHSYFLWENSWLLDEVLNALYEFYKEGSLDYFYLLSRPNPRIYFHHYQPWITYMHKLPLIMPFVSEFYPPHSSYLCLIWFGNITWVVWRPRARAPQAGATRTARAAGRTRAGGRARRGCWQPTAPIWSQLQTPCCRRGCVVPGGNTTRINSWYKRLRGRYWV